ncbi:MAG: hypothetical protein PVG71_12635 [Anaerolineae bacterium]
MSREESAPLPDFLHRFFWDTDFGQLRASQHQRYVIERLLEYGDDRAIRWLSRTYGVSAIADVVRQSRKISRNTANLWALVLDIPREQITCLSERFPVTLEAF